MGRKIYLEEKKRKRSSDISSGNTHRLLKTLIVFFLISAVTATAVLSFIKFSDRYYDNLYLNFTEAMNEKDYNLALQTYRNVYEKTTGRSMFFHNTAKYKKILELIEEKTERAINTPLNNLSERQKTFSLDNIDLINSFEEVSIRKINAWGLDFLESLLYGQYSLDNAVLIMDEIERLSLKTEWILAYRSELEEIYGFHPQMQQILFNHENGNYLETAYLISSGVSQNTGFIEEYLTGYLLELKTEMYPVKIDMINNMISRHQYYSAKFMIEKLTEFYPDDITFMEKLDYVSTFTADNLIEYYQPVEHLSFRPLVSDMMFDFTKDGYASNAEDLLVTSDEFNKILEQLYENNYILINIDSLLDDSGKRAPLLIPQGKKPLILTVEGLNYYASRRRTGNSLNLVPGENNKILSTYRNDQGEYVTDSKGEIIGILDDFIDKNPGFSFDGAKGNISLTGYECIFGYVVNTEQAQNRANAYAEHLSSDFSISIDEIEENILKVKEITELLKNNGWTFSSSTYGNIYAGLASLDELKTDTRKWKEQVGKFTGPVRTFIFPHGSSIFAGDIRSEYLVENGFDIHSGIGPTAYFYYGDNHLFMDRVTINGFNMRTMNLSRFFDVETVYSERRSKSR